MSSRERFRHDSIRVLVSRATPVAPIQLIMASWYALFLRLRAYAVVFMLCAVVSSITGRAAVSAAAGGAPATPLTIASDPAGAQVYLDGSFVGQTPLNLAAAPGSHRVR